jgi:opacity protein-like surface antigen
MGAIIVGAITFFAIISQTHDWWLIASAVGGAVCAQLVSRLGIEGAYDYTRAQDGNANKGDVPVASAKLDVTKVAP